MSDFITKASTPPAPLGCGLFRGRPGPGRSRRGLEEREHNGEGRTFARRTAHRDVATVGHDHILDNGEPESRAPGLARAIFVHPVKALENMLLVGPRNAGPIVGDLHLDIRTGALEVKIYRKAGSVAVF